MPHRRRLGLTFLLCLLAGPRAVADVPAAAPGADLLQRRPFAAGEFLRFRIRLGPVTVGEAALEIPALVDCGGRAAYEIRYTARSAGALSALYPVRDLVTSWADTVDFRTYRLRKRLREGSYRETCDWRVDHARGLAADRDRGSLPVEAGVHDVFSALLRVRASRLAPGTALRIPVVLGGATSELTVAVGPRRPVATPLGGFTCLPVQPELDGRGPFRHDGPVVIDLSDDQRRWPVRIRLAVPVVGSLTVELTRAAGTRTVAAARAGVRPDCGRD